MTDLSCGSGGWISLPSRGGADGVHVRLGSKDGRPIVTDVYIHGSDITPEVMQRISMSRIRATINLMDNLPLDEKGTEPSLTELRQRTNDSLSQPVNVKRPRLTRPNGNAPEVFYLRVADAYREYAPRTRAPAKEMAAEAGVPIATAHRWISEARRRELLPLGRKGRAG